MEIWKMRSLPLSNLMDKYPNQRIPPRLDKQVSHLFDVFKVDRVPVLLEAADNLDAAISRAIALRENFPGEYFIVSQATGRQIVFTSKGGIKRT